MASDELSSKLNQRLKIEEGTLEPVAVDGPPSHHDDAEQPQHASTANADAELNAKLLRRDAINEGESVPRSAKVFNVYTEFKEFSRKQIKDMEKMFKT